MIWSSLGIHFTFWKRFTCVACTFACQCRCMYRSSQLHQQKFIKCFQIDSSNFVEELLLWLNQFFNLEDLFGYISDILACRNHAHNQNNTFKHFYCTSDSWIVLVHADKGSYLLQIYFKFNGLAITTLFVGQDMLNFATEHLPVSVCSHDTDYCLKFRHMGNTNSNSRSLWCQIYMCTGKVHVYNIKLWYCMILSVIALPLVFTKQVNHT